MLVIFILFILSKRIRKILNILFDKISSLPSFKQETLEIIEEQKLKEL